MVVAACLLSPVFAFAQDADVAGGKDQVQELTIPVAAPALWSGETPNLYQLLVTVKDALATAV